MNLRPRFWTATLGLVMAALVSLSARPAHAADPQVPRLTPSIAIVVDGSGSMWGKMPGDSQPRVYLTRDAVKAALEVIAPETRIGLVSFGHRRRADCADAGVVAPLAPVTTSGVAAGVEKLNPIGKGPLVLGLEKAGEALAGEQGPKAIVLIHDDSDNCNRDPCEITADLLARNPGLKIHVVTLLAKPQDAGRMACLTRVTGGQSFPAADAQSLRTQTLAAIRLAAAAPVQRPAAKAPAVAPLQPAQPTGPAGVSARALLTTGGAPLTTAVQWRLIAQAADGDRVIVERTAVGLSQDLPKGTYRVEARSGLQQAAATVAITDDKRAMLDLVLAGARLAPSVVTRPGRPLLTPALLSIARVEAGAGTGTGATNGAPGTAATAEQGRTIWSGPAWSGMLPGEGPPSFNAGADVLLRDGLVLPAGTYDVSAIAGLARETRRIELKEGQEQGLQIELPVGTLAPTVVSPSPVVSQTGGSQTGASQTGLTPLAAPLKFIVQQTDVEAADGLKTIAVSTQSAPVFPLLAATYRVTVRQGLLEASETIAVPAGERAVVRLTLPRASLTVRTEARLLPKHGLSVDYRLERLDPREPAVMGTLKPGQPIVVPPGRYRVTAKLGMHNAILERDVRLADGEAQTLDLTPASGSARFRLAAGSPANAPLWEVSDANGRIVMRSVEAEPIAALAQGAYDVSVDYGDGRVASTFRIEAGTDIDVVLENR